MNCACTLCIGGCVCVCLRALQEASKALSAYKLLVVVDAKLPVANFGYDGGPSQLVTLPEDAVWQFDAAWGVAEALRLLSEELGPASTGVKPGVSCSGVFCAAVQRPPLPPPGAKLSAAAMCAVVAALQPEDAIIVDESLTSGTAYWYECQIPAHA